MIFVTALSVSSVTLAAVFGGALLGIYFRNALSDERLRDDVRDVIKLSAGLTGAMAAVVPGLLINPAKLKECVAVVCKGEIWTKVR